MCETIPGRATRMHASTSRAAWSTAGFALQGSADKVDVLRRLLAEAPRGAWLLWADFDTVFANRAFSFPFAQYAAEGRHMVLGGTLSEILAGNGYSGSFAPLFCAQAGQRVRPRCAKVTSRPHHEALYQQPSQLQPRRLPEHHALPHPEVDGQSRSHDCFAPAEADTGVLLLRNTDWTRVLYGRIRSMLDSRSTVDKVVPRCLNPMYCLPMLPFCCCSGASRRQH
jgi:hypothetical protein